MEKILTSAWELILIGIFCGFGNPKKSSQIRRNLLRICKLRKILRKSAGNCRFERTSFSNPQKIKFLHENANTRNFAMNNSHPKKILEFEKILSACNSWLCYERTSFSNPQKLRFSMKMQIRGILPWIIPIHRTFLSSKKFFRLAIRDYAMGTTWQSMSITLLADVLRNATCRYRNIQLENYEQTLRKFKLVWIEFCHQFKY